MKKLTRSVVAIAIAAVVAVFAAKALKAQNLAGNWQGTLQAGKDVRLVLVVSSANPGAPSAVMYLIDQSPQGIPASSFAVRGSTVLMTVDRLGLKFEGTLSADANTIAGTFAQNGKPLSLTLTRATPDTAWKIPEPPKPMAANAPAVFEVATIKPSQPGGQGKLLTMKGRQVITINTSLKDLIVVAYGLHPGQVVGGPAWMDTDKYDITGQPEAQGQPTLAQLNAMIKTLVEDRFKLTTHLEKRELSVYAIVVGKDGPKMRKNETNPNGLPGLIFKGLGVLPATNATMGDFARVLQSSVLDRPVVDRTGLQGRWDFTLTWTPDETQFASAGVRVPPPTNDPNAPPVISTAFQEQLGLRLESTKAPVDVLVVDRVERPSEN